MSISIEVSFFYLQVECKQMLSVMSAVRARIFERAGAPEPVEPNFSDFLTRILKSTL